MANEEIAYSVTVDSSKAGKSLSELKKEFKEQQKELSNLTVGTKEYIAQLQKLGGIKDDIGDLNDAIKSFNPDAKIQTLSKVTSGLAGGFAAAQGAVALFGGESKELEKTLIKVQAAMAFQQGIQGLEGLGDAFKNLFNIIRANPLGAFLTLIAAVAVAATAFYYSMDKSSEATRKLNEQLEIQNLLISNLKRETTRQVELLKSQGASELEIIALKQKLAKEEIFGLELSIKSHESKIREIADNDTLVESLSKAAAWTMRKLGNEKLAGVYEIAALASKKERRGEEQKLIDEEKQGLLDLKKQVEILSNEKVTAENKATQNYVENLNKQKEAKKTHDAEIAKLREAQGEYEKQKADKDFAAAIAEDEARLIEIQTAYQVEKDLNDFKILEAERVAEEKKKINEAEFAQTIATAQATNESLSNLSNFLFDLKRKNLEKGSARELAVAKKQFQVNKALAITSNIISTIVGVTNALSAQSVIPDPFGTILKVANAAAVGISGTVATAKIASQKFNEGGGGAGGGGGGGTPSIPTPNVAPPSQGSTQLNADGSLKNTSETKSQPIKAYIVETEVTKKQKQISSIEANSKL